MEQPIGLFGQKKPNDGIGHVTIEQLEKSICIGFIVDFIAWAVVITRHAIIHKTDFGPENYPMQVFV